MYGGIKDKSRRKNADRFPPAMTVYDITSRQMQSFLYYLRRLCVVLCLHSEQIYSLSYGRYVERVAIVSGGLHKVARHIVEREAHHRLAAFDVEQSLSLHTMMR